MKKISIVLFSVIMALSASAQKVVVNPGVHPVPRVVYYYPRPYFYNPYYFGLIIGMDNPRITIIVQQNWKGRYRILKTNTATGSNL